MACKSIILQFKSGYRLIIIINNNLRGHGEMVDTTDLKSVDQKDRESSNLSVPIIPLFRIKFYHF